MVVFEVDIRDFLSTRVVGVFFMLRDIVTPVQLLSSFTASFIFNMVSFTPVALGHVYLVVWLIVFILEVYKY